VEIEVLSFGGEREDDVLTELRGVFRYGKEEGSLCKFWRCCDIEGLLSLMGRSLARQIGVNYIGTSQELRGCINDAKNLMRFLCERFGYKQDDIVLLSDDARNPRQIPTRENMIAAMRWLVDNAQPNDSLFFH
jgi:hypothetical protein